jgi:HK97 gp10 family phage protein
MEIRNESINLIRENGDGPAQVRYNPKRIVNVSQPGDPPNADTGRLIQSIRVERDGKAYLVGTNLKYGAWLEFGTQVMRPRPWLSTAVNKTNKKMKQIYQAAFQKFFKGFKE